MPKAYWIPHLDVHNPQGFQAYRDLADAGHKTFGSKLLARGGRREVPEGKMRARNVLREFNSYDEALAYYHGPDYSRAHPLREPHSACDFLIVEGFDGPVKVLTSCPSCLQGLSRFSDDAGTQADYIVVELARHILGEQWMPDYVAKANRGGIERVLV